MARRTSARWTRYRAGRSKVLAEEAKRLGVKSGDHTELAFQTQPRAAEELRGATGAAVTGPGRPPAGPDAPLRWIDALVKQQGLSVREAAVIVAEDTSYEDLDFEDLDDDAEMLRGRYRRWLKRSKG